MSGRKRATHPLIVHNLLCDGPQTLIFVAAPPPPEHPKVVICIVTQISLLSLSVFWWVVVEIHARCICVAWS